MAYVDAMRDRGLLEQRDDTTDGGFGQSASTNQWAPTFSIAGRLRTLSARELRAYRRDGYETVMRFETTDNIGRTSNKAGFVTNSLRQYLQSNQAHFRLNIRGRTLNIIGIVRPMEGLHDTAGHHVWLDCIETPIPTGHMDAT
jgi:hypothetical protein